MGALLSANGTKLFSYAYLMPPFRAVNIFSYFTNRSYSLISSNFESSVQDAALTLFRFDVSFRVQVPSLRLIEVVVAAEIKFTKSRRSLCDVAEGMVLPISQSLIREYKQRRKKMGSTVAAATLVCVGE